MGIKLRSDTRQRLNDDKRHNVQSETKILMAEKFINIQFLVPFPQFNLKIIEENKLYSEQLSEMWTMQNLFCELDF